MTQLMRATAATPGVPKLAGVFAVVALGTAAVMITDLVSPSVTQSGLQQNAVRLGVLAVLLYGAWLALTRARFSDRARLTIWSVIALPLLVWQSIVWWLAVAGVFQGEIGLVPLLPLAIVLPLLIGLPILLSSKTVGRMLDATPPSWLVGLQAYRVFGSVFLTGWLAGNLPTIPAVPAGAGDALVGMLALPVALVLTSRARSARSMALAWNVLGIPGPGGRHNAGCAGESRRAADGARSGGSASTGADSRVRCTAVPVAAFPLASAAPPAGTPQPHASARPHRPARAAPRYGTHG